MSDLDKINSIFNAKIDTVKNKEDLQNLKTEFFGKNGQITQQFKTLVNLNPEKRKYFVRGQITTETAIHASLLKDIYLTIGDQLDDGSWIVNVQFNYFIRWIWFSAALMIISGLFLARSLNRVHS